MRVYIITPNKLFSKYTDSSCPQNQRCARLYCNSNSNSSKLQCQLILKQIICLKRCYKCHNHGYYGKCSCLSMVLIRLFSINNRLIFTDPKALDGKWDILLSSKMRTSTLVTRLLSCTIASVILPISELVHRTEKRKIKLEKLK